MTNSTLTIKRTDQYANKMRKINIILDGKDIGWIANDELKSFKIEEGHHTLSAKIDWCGAEILAINVAANEEKKFELGSPIQFQKRRFVFMALRVGLLFGGVALGNHWANKNIIFITVGILFVWIIAEQFLSKSRSAFYYMTFGHKRFLYLKEM